MTQITITLQDEQERELRRQAEEVGRSTEAHLTELMARTLSGPSDDSDVLAEVLRRQADGRIGRPVDEVFDDLNRRYVMCTR